MKRIKKSILSSLVASVSLNLLAQHLGAQTDHVVSGNLFVNGNSDLNGNLVSFGSLNSDPAQPGVLLNFTDGAGSKIIWSATQPVMTWLWQTPAGPQLKIDSSNIVSLYAPGSSAATLTLNPSGSSTFSQGLTVGGVLTASGGLSSPNGIVTGGAGGLILSAGGINQNVTLTPTGTGITTTGGKVSVGTASSTAQLTVAGIDTSSGNTALNITASTGKTLLAVKNNGNVGVGTISPSAKLDVVGDAAVSSNIRVAGDLVLPGTGTDSFKIRNVSSEPNSEVRLIVGDDAIDNQQDRLSIGAVDHRTQNWYPRLTVMSSGNVGIGTSTPSEKLEVNGNLRLSGNITSINASFKLPDRSGTLLVNTATEQSSISLGRSYAATGYASTALGSNTNAAGMVATALGIGTYSGGRASTSTGYLTAAVGEATFSSGLGTIADSYGSVALGTYNIRQGDALNWVPTDDLFVIGNGSDNINRSNAFFIRKNGDTYISGNLGIGTTAPTAKLEVVGDVNISGALTVNRRLTKLRVDPQGDISMGQFTAGRDIP